MIYSSVSNLETAFLSPSGVSFLSATKPEEQERRMISERLISNCSAVSSISSICFFVNRIWSEIVAVFSLSIGRMQKRYTVMSYSTRENEICTDKQYKSRLTTNWKTAQ